MVGSRAGSRRPVSGTQGVPHEPLSRRDAKKACWKQVDDVVGALEQAGIVNKQSGGVLRNEKNRELVLAALEARRRGCRDVPALQAALAREEPASTVSAWLRERGCDLGSQLGALHRMMLRLKLLYSFRMQPVLELAGDLVIAGILPEGLPEGDKRAAQVAFAVLLSKVCKATRAKVIDWLREPGQQSCLEAAKVFLKKHAPKAAEPMLVAVQVIDARFRKLGEDSHNRRRYWKGVGCQIAEISKRTDVRSIDDYMFRIALCPLQRRGSAQLVVSAWPELQPMLQSEGPDVELIAKDKIREYLRRYADWSS